jgi:hypothetical protein
MIALSDTIHFYPRPDAKDRLLEFFTAVLELNVRPVTLPYVRGSPEPMYAVEFSNGARMSVEFTADALSDQQAERGPWFELRTQDAEGLQQKALAFGLKRVVHPYTPFFYIQAPGGQVFRIVGEKSGSGGER